MTHDIAAGPDRLTVRSSEDMLALVPYVLGFEPEESVVMLTFGGAGIFHARVDLPRDPGDLPEVVDALLAPALRHGVAAVAFVVLGEDAAVGQVVAAELHSAFVSSGIVVVDCLRAHANRYHSCAPGRLGPAEGVPYDTSNHPFVAMAVARGQVTHRSRADLAASLARDPAAAREVLAQIPGPGWEPDPVAEAAWAVRTVRAGLASADCSGVPASELPTASVGRLLAGLHREAVRDAVWLLLDRSLAREWVGFWTQVVRRAPAGFTAAAATMLAFGAWVGGQGALAWCALDISELDDPDYGPAGLLALGLHEALPPSAWEEMRRARPGPDPA